VAKLWCKYIKNKGVMDTLRKVFASGRWCDKSVRPLAVNLRIKEFFGRPDAYQIWSFDLNASGRYKSFQVRSEFQAA